jgi:hypothetical protein
METPKLKQCLSPDREIKTPYVTRVYQPRHISQIEEAKMKAHPTSIRSHLPKSLEPIRWLGLIPGQVRATDEMNSWISKSV